MWGLNALMREQMGRGGDPTGIIGGRGGVGGNMTDFTARGRAIRAGDMSQLTSLSDRAAAVQTWAQAQAKDRGVLTAEQWAGAYGQQSAMAGRMLNTGDIDLEMVEQMAIRGIDAGQMSQLARAVGGQESDWQRMAQMMVNRGQDPGTIRKLGALAPLTQMGVMGMNWVEKNIDNLPSLSARQQGNLQAFAGGDRLMWSRLARGENLGMGAEMQDILTSSGMDLSWAETVDEMGRPLYTEELRGLQQQQMNLTDQQQQFGMGQRRNAFQASAMYTTGQRFGNVQGQVGSQFAQLAAASGGVWGIQARMSAASYSNQMGNFDFQAQMAGVSAAHYAENYGVQKGRINVQRGWGAAAEERYQERTEASDAWRQYQFDYRQNRSQLQFGRTMEDLDEGIRFATGRQKLRLQKQKERATVDYTMAQGYAEEEQNYWEKQKQFRDEEHEAAESHRMQRLEWADEDLDRGKRQHDEIAGLRAAHAEKQKQHAQTMYGLQEEKTALDQAYWKEQKAADELAIEQAEEYIDKQKEIRDAQVELAQMQQDAVANFTLGMQGLTQEFLDFIGEIKAKLNDTAYYPSSQGEWMGASDPNYGDNPIMDESGGGTVDEEEDDDDIPPRPPTGIPKHSGGPIGSVWNRHMDRSRSEMMIRAQEGEWIVPRGGELIKTEDERVILLLERIADALDEGNGRFQIIVSNPERTIQRMGGVLDASFG
jgi:hypothetical protein